MQQPGVTHANRALLSPFPLTLFASHATHTRRLATHKQIPPGYPKVRPSQTRSSFPLTVVTRLKWLDTLIDQPPSPFKETRSGDFHLKRNHRTRSMGYPSPSLNPTDGDRNWKLAIIAADHETPGSWSPHNLWAYREWILLLHPYPIPQGATTRIPYRASESRVSLIPASETVHTLRRYRLDTEPTNPPNP
ncbi:hypothetical protein NMY22_g17998 [Coprinellus aureogranulatus]|nr:hypothetical protein NMY22_g17998 [Coprinellus aureogranulatus]